MLDRYALFLKIWRLANYLFVKINFNLSLLLSYFLRKVSVLLILFWSWLFVILFFFIYLVKVQLYRSEFILIFICLFWSFFDFLLRPIRNRRGLCWFKIYLIKYFFIINFFFNHLTLRMIIRINSLRLIDLWNLLLFFLNRFD